MRNPCGEPPLRLGVGEQPLNPAPQPHGSLVEAGLHFGARHVPHVFVRHACHPPKPAGRALLTKLTRPAVGLTSDVDAGSRPRIEATMTQALSGRTGIAVPFPVISEGSPRELAFDLLGSFQHGDVGDRALVAHEGEEGGAAVGGVGCDALGPIAEPLRGARQHVAPGVHLGREAGRARRHVERDAAWGVDEDVERIAEATAHGAGRPCRSRIGARHLGRRGAA